MALSGVRSSWLMLARNSDFAWLASSARSSPRRISRPARRAAAPGVRASAARLAGPRPSPSAAARSRSAAPRAASAAVMSVPTETKPPSLVRRSLICSQRPSSSCASKVRAPGIGAPLAGQLAAHDRLAAGRRRSPRRASRGCTASSGRPCRLWNFELHSTSRLSASHSTKASEIVSIASRRRMSAVVRALRRAASAR